MSKTEGIQVTALTGGEFKSISEEIDSSETVLALPLGRLIVKIVRVPEEGCVDPAAFAAPLLQAMSPYPDEPLTVGYEVVRESERELVILAAALPESATDDLAEVLDVKKLNVTRVDALVLGELRKRWEEINTADGKRRLVKIKSPDGVALVVLDGDTPVAIRSLAASDGEQDNKRTTTSGEDSKRTTASREELMLLLEAEDFGGPKELAETLEFESDVEKAMEGIAERSAEEGALNALPSSWREVLEESRFKTKLAKRLSVAGGVWAFLMAVLFGVPIVFGFLADHQKSLSREHSRQYNEVAGIREKVNIVKKYSDHSQGALEIMKAVSDRLPQGVDLDNWNFSREDGVRTSGVAATDTLVYEFKRNMESVLVGEEERLFKSVKLGNISASSKGQKFSIELGYATEEEEE